MSKKLTIKELIAQKEQLKNKKAQTAELYVESLGGNIVVNSANNSLILESQSLGQEDPTRADIYMVYQCVKEPNLKDKELQEAYECTEPLDIVERIFLPGEIAGIADQIMKLSGFGSVNKVAKELKN